MKLVIENVGRVSSADVELGGITVLAGANGTGKSTVSRALMTLSSVSRRVNSLILSERLRSVLGALRDSFQEVGGGLVFGFNEMSARMRDVFLPCLSAEWWRDDANVTAWLRERHMKELYVMPFDFLDDPKCLEAIRKARTQVLEAINRSDEEYVRHNCRKAFVKAFNRQIGPVFTNDEGIVSRVAVEYEVSRDNDVFVSITNGSVSGYGEIGRTFFPTVAYFEPLNYVDFVNGMEQLDDRYTAGSLCSCNVVRKDPPKNLSLEEQTELDEAMRIVQEIIDNIHGRLVRDGDNIKFSEHFSDGDHLMDVQNIASGMKTMAAIVRAVENRSIRRGSMIIIDEPETNLHPEWQVFFARFLVCLSQRLGVSLLLNTHSPYFLQAIRVYSRRLDVENRYYNMVPDSDGDSFHTDEVTKRIEEVFKTMAKPFDDLKH